MARGRMISKSLSTSEKYAALATVAGDLDEFCQTLYPLLVVHTDDFGRLQGDPFTVKLQCYPASRRELDAFATALRYLHEVELITWYVVGGKYYVQIEQFEPHQAGLHKRTRSQFPEIPGNSRKLPETPGQVKGREEKRREEKGTRTNTPATGVAASASAADPSIVDRCQSVLDEAKANHAALLETSAKLKATIDTLRQGFTLFWAHYPRHTAKKAAEKAWNTIHPDDALQTTILAAVDRQRLSADWLKDGGTYIPHARTWLMGQRWMDEIRPPPSTLSPQQLQIGQAGRDFLALSRSAGKTS